MKKMTDIVLAVMMLLTCIPVFAYEVPQPEGGMKFESNWAMMCGLIGIVYEEEGYRVEVELFNQEECTGTLWEYSCYYNEEKDILESISSRKIGYTLNIETLDRTFDEYEYDGIDDLDNTTVFSLSEDGALSWKDGHENMGADLEFRDIGCFDGVWRNDEEEVYTEFHWEGLFDENTYYYSIFIARGADDHYADFHMIGEYNPETGKLECYDTDNIPIEDAEDFFAAEEAGEPFDMFFSGLGNGKILYETANGIELEYDLLGPES